MKYRKFGKIDFDVSSFGFGCMRLPTLDNKPMSPNIDEAESIRMIHYAIEKGVNYFDTAYPYHGGQSELLLGKALQGGLREKVKIATKSPVWMINSKGMFTSILEEQMKKLQTDYIDFYLLHSLDKGRWQDIILKHKVLEEAENAIKNGMIKHFGFSFHDDEKTFFEIIDGYDKWEFCQIQYNYMDINRQAGKAGFKYAASKGIGIVIMEPLLGGRLSNPPENIKKIFSDFDAKMTPTEWAFKWLWSHKAVSTILSGVSSMEQLKENISSVDLLSEQYLTNEELEIIETARKFFKERIKIECTKCNYCLPCPNGVNIPRNFELYNDAFMFGNPIPPRITYQRFLPEIEKASNCIECGECEGSCPQKLKITKLLEEVDNELTKSIF